MKLKEFFLLVFSLIFTGILTLGSHNVHSLICHSSSDSETAITHCEQCDFIYVNNTTSFINFNYYQLNFVNLFNNIKLDFNTNHKEPTTQSLCELYFFNRPPPPFLV